LLANGLLDLI